MQWNAYTNRICASKTSTANIDTGVRSQVITSNHIHQQLDSQNWWRVAVCVCLDCEWRRRQLVFKIGCDSINLKLESLYMKPPSKRRNEERTRRRELKHSTISTFLAFTHTIEPCSDKVVYAHTNITAINLVKNWIYHVDLSDITKRPCKLGNHAVLFAHNGIREWYRWPKRTRIISSVTFIPGHGEWNREPDGEWKPRKIIVVVVN